MSKQLPQKMGPQTRNLSIRAQDIAVDVANRTVELSFSSDAAIDMWFGKESLSHAPGAMRVTDRTGNLPLLYNHSMDDLLGVVESVRVDVAAGKGYAVVRFGKDDRGEWAMQQCLDGILTNVSFMYRVYKYMEDTETETYTALDWEVLEISLVTVPADASVGVGRAAGENEVAVEVITRQITPAAAETTKESIMTTASQNNGTEATGAIQTPSAEELRAIQALGAEGERKRIAEIDAMCRAHGIGEDIRVGMIQKGASIEEARGIVLDHKLQQSNSQRAASMGDGFAPDMSDSEKSKYSLTRAINAAISGNWKDAGFEAEVSNDIAKRMGKSTQGFFMPTNIPFAQRSAYAVGTAGQGTTGGTLVATNLLAGSFIEVLRNKARVLQLGATVLSGLVGNVDIPRQSGATNTFWVGENGNLTEAEGTFDKVSLSLKSIGTYSMISRNMLLQSTPDIEMLVRADLIAQIALGIDKAALSGSGSANQPTGITNTSGIGSVVGGTNGAAITIDHLIDLETAITSANAPEDSLAYLANARTIGALKKLKSTTGSYLWNGAMAGATQGTPGEINGYPVARSNQARGDLTKGTGTNLSEIIFGNWSEVLIGEWGVLEIMPNPYDATAYKQGAVLLRAMQSVDIAVRHAASFAVMSDAITG